MVKAGGGDVAKIQEAGLARAGGGFADAVEVAPIDREVGGHLISTGDALFLFAGDAVDFLCAGFRHFEKVEKMLLVGVVAEADAREGAYFEVLLFACKEVASFDADFGFGERRLGVLHDELRDAVFAAVVVDEVAGAKFSEGDGARPRDEFAGGIARWYEDTEGQPREVVAGEETFGREVAVRLELGALSAAGRADIVPQEVELTVGLILVALVLLVFVTADGEEAALDGLGGAGEERSGGTVEVAPTIHGFV